MTLHYRRDDTGITLCCSFDLGSVSSQLERVLLNEFPQLVARGDVIVMGFVISEAIIDEGLWAVGVAKEVAKLFRCRLDRMDKDHESESHSLKLTESIRATILI